MAEATIKDYLVGLGFQVDDKSYKAFLNKLNDTTKEIEKNASAITSLYLKAGTAVVSALVSITSATVALIDKTAEADLKYQKFALHMYTTNEIAKRLKITTDALGESLDDIAWTKLYHSFVHENPRFPKCKNGTLPDFYLIGSDIMARGGTLCKEVYFYELVKG